ncbi:Large-conductance mechanosensitive channel [Dissostichus eleginoides]|uniref:Large-conductance mechanosensitive channel n=1 Tax=Dissostichus eleginoides TaxID=100907 RepID=A0AAD9F444_DISEL|nr:Large-conductance mechanosensitive channel [Dissostichus eleginoides]
MPGGSTKRQCPHCLEKLNRANRRCTKCGKMLELKSRQTARMKDFRQKAKDWAQKVHRSRNQSKIFNNSALMVEKLKALGYFPLLLWGKYHNKKKKWTAQLQCPFELPLVAHAVLEKIVCLFEGFLEAWDPETEGLGQHERTGEEDDQTEQGEGGEMDETEGTTEMQEMETEGDIETQRDRLASEGLERGLEGQKDSEEEFGPVVAGEMAAGKEKEQAVEVEKGEFEAEKKVATNRKRAVKISAKKKRGKKKTNKEEVCEYHSKLVAFPVQSVSRTRERKGCKEVLVHWLPCPACKKTWPPSWEPQMNINMTVS